MTPNQNMIFIVGVLIAVGLASSITGIVLHRVFPDHPWVTVFGPLCAMGAVLGMANVLRRR